MKLGCWGPVVKCNVPKRGWINGVGGCPNVGGICIGCTMPGFPDKFMPFMDEPPGRTGVDRRVSALYGSRDPQAARHHRADGSTRSRSGGTEGDELLTGYHRRPGEPTGAGDAHGRTELSHGEGPTDEPAATSSRWPGTRSPGSWAASASTPRSTSTRSKVVECHSTSSIFRGYSIFMKGKDPRDAHFITSRICGICGDNHATCSCYAQNMAYGVHPPHLGEWIVNLGEAAEYMFDHNIFQENLVGVDFCEKMVERDQPGRAGTRPTTPRRRTPRDHGYKTIGDIMRSLNPFTGEFYREALQVSRLTREMFCLMEGRHVHPSTLYPGRRRHRSPPSSCSPTTSTG